MKEEEATEKWCPMSRCIFPGDPQTGDGYGPYNRWEDDDLPMGTYCIASSCMMWRTKSEFLTDGYCGLGGKE